MVGSSKLTFGSPSPLGDASASLGSAVVASEPSSGGFSAFSSNSGFAAFAGKTTSSFGGLLRGNDEAKDPSKMAISAVDTLPKAGVKPPFGSKGLTQEKPRQSLLSTDGSEVEAAQEKSKDSLLSTSMNTQDPGVPFTSPRAAPAPDATKKYSDDTLDETDGQGEAEGATASSERLSQPSLGSLLASISATSQGSSFVDVSVPSDEEDSAPATESPDRQRDSGFDLEDDTQSFLSEGLSDESPDERSDEETSRRPSKSSLCIAR